MVDMHVSPSPLGTNLGFEVGWTGLGLGLGGLGPGLDNHKLFIFVPAASGPSELFNQVSQAYFPTLC